MYEKLSTNLRIIDLEYNCPGWYAHSEFYLSYCEIDTILESNGRDPSFEGPVFQILRSSFGPRCLQLVLKKVRDLDLTVRAHCRFEAEDGNAPPWAPPLVAEGVCNTS